MSITIDITDVTEVPMPRAGEFALRAEAAGFDGVGVRDNQATGRDSYLRLALSALQTSKLTLFPAVSNPVTRHPTVLASLINSLRELAPERIRLVMGGGEGSVAHIGVPPAKIAQVRDATLVIRRLLTGETLGTEDTSHGSSHFASDQRTPIYINASSPRMLELAGEIGDGAMLMVGTDTRIVELARNHIGKGMDVSVLNRSIRDTSFALPVFMDTNIDVARQRARTTLFWWLRRSQRLFTRNLHLLGLAMPSLSGPQDIPDAALPSLCTAMGLVGTPHDCVEQLKQFVVNCEVDHVHLLIYGDPTQIEWTFDSLCKLVIPKFK